MLDGVIAKIVDKRHTPSGIPITRFALEHQSQQSEAGLNRRIHCQVLVIVSGLDLNQQFEKAVIGQEISVRGFLNQIAFQGRKQKLCINAESIKF